MQKKRRRVGLVTALLPSLLSNTTRGDIANMPASVTLKQRRGKPRKKRHAPYLQPDHRSDIINVSDNTMTVSLVPRWQLADDSWVEVTFCEPVVRFGQLSMRGRLAADVMFVQSWL